MDIVSWKQNPAIGDHNISFFSSFSFEETFTWNSNQINDEHHPLHQKGHPHLFSISTILGRIAALPGEPHQVLTTRQNKYEIHIRAGGRMPFCNHFSIMLILTFNDTCVSNIKKGQPPRCYAEVSGHYGDFIAPVDGAFVLLIGWRCLWPWLLNYSKLERWTSVDFMAVHQYYDHTSEAYCYKYMKLFGNYGRTHHPCGNFQLIISHQICWVFWCMFWWHAELWKENCDNCVRNKNQHWVPTSVPLKIPKRNALPVGTLQKECLQCRYLDEAMLVNSTRTLSPQTQEIDTAEGGSKQLSSTNNFLAKCD